LARAKEKSWAEIGFDSWQLGAEAWMVVALRSARLLGGGEAACREARMMVTEKIDSNRALTNALLAGELGTSPNAVLGNAVAHYLTGVRANRKRLSRK
jgi:hypothetical protein